ncbi:unnamed protein product [Pleuronectes platessa]|uniref:Uncharacterized protein n=1 Tax=Pleuronectes platessa TaxID=8262 RepID=A0A9N7YJY7_PLEPL|nr:unnamed protein product [Pleuronectes platessa]
MQFRGGAVLGSSRQQLSTIPPTQQPSHLRPSHHIVSSSTGAFRADQDSRATAHLHRASVTCEGNRTQCGSRLQRGPGPTHHPQQKAPLFSRGSTVHGHRRRTTQLEPVPVDKTPAVTSASRTRDCDEPAPVDDTGRADLPTPDVCDPQPGGDTPQVACRHPRALNIFLFTGKHEHQTPGIVFGVNFPTQTEFGLSQIRRLPDA